MLRFGCCNPQREDRSGGRQSVRCERNIKSGYVVESHAYAASWEQSKSAHYEKDFPNSLFHYLMVWSMLG